MTMQHWTTAAEGCDTLVCLQAFNFPDGLDVSLEGSGVFPSPECRMTSADDALRTVELFCGGFSGWSHVGRFLQTMEMPLERCLALDLDRDCVLAFHKTFGGYLKLLGVPVQLDDDGSLPPQLVIESDLLEFDWAHLSGRQTFEIGLASPPCPPWSKAAVNPPGLRRKDGILTPAAIAMFALLGCKVMCLENVAGLFQHSNWRTVTEWIFLVL